MPIGGAYLHRALQQKLPQVLQRRLRNLPFDSGELIPTIADLQPGAAELVQDQILEYGEAGLLAPDADDVPMIEISASENNYRIVMPVAGFSISMQEERAAEQAQNNGVRYSVRDTKMRGARRVISEKSNKVAAYGSSALGFTGMVNDSNVTLTNSSFDPYAATTTASDLADFVLEELNDIATESNNVENPTHLGASTNFVGLLERRTMPDSGMKVYDFIVNTQRERSTYGIREIVPLTELLSVNLESNGVHAGGTNKDRFVLFPVDPEVTERHIELIQLAPIEYTQIKGLKRLFPMFQCVSETIINFPGALRYVDSPKKS